MITIFNRQELCITDRLEEVTRVREILLANNMDYFVKVTSPRESHAMTAGRGRTASFGYSRMPSQYRIYVRKSDWEYAAHLIGNKS